MISYPFIVAEATLVFLAVILIIEYGIRRRDVSRVIIKNRQKQQQLATISAELNTLKKKLARKSEIADQFPRIAKKLTEKSPSDAYPAIAVRAAKEFFQARKVGYFAAAEGSSDYTLVIGVGFPQDWAGKVRIHSDEGMLGMALQKNTVPRPVVEVLRDRLVGCEFLQPTFIVVVKTAFVIVDEDGRGDMHRVAKQKAFPDPAFPKTCLDLRCDGDECPSSGNVEPKLLPVVLQIPPPRRTGRGDIARTTPFRYYKNIMAHDPKRGYDLQVAGEDPRRIRPSGSMDKGRS